jgi:hypothetical protein
LYGSYVLQRAGIGFGYYFELQPRNVLTAWGRHARTDFGCDQAIFNLPFWTGIMQADSLALLEKRRHWFSKLPTQLTTRLRRLALVDLRALGMRLEHNGLSLGGDFVGQFGS